MHDVTRGQNTVLDVALRMVELEVQALFLCGGAQHNRIAACTSQHHLRPSLHVSACAMMNPSLTLLCMQGSDAIMMAVMSQHKAIMILDSAVYIVEVLVLQQVLHASKSAS